MDVFVELVPQIVRVSAEEWLGAHNFHRHDRVELALQLLLRFRDLVSSRWLLVGRGLPCDTGLLASVTFDGAHTLDMIFMLVSFSLFQNRRICLTSTSIDDLLG